MAGRPMTKIQVANNPIEQLNKYAQAFRGALQSTIGYVSVKDMDHAKSSLVEADYAFNQWKYLVQVQMCETIVVKDGE